VAAGTVVVAAVPGAATGLLAGVVGAAGADGEGLAGVTAAAPAGAVDATAAGVVAVVGPGSAVADGVADAAGAAAAGDDAGAEGEVAGGVLTGTVGAADAGVVAGEPAGAGSGATGVAAGAGAVAGAAGVVAGVDTGPVPGAPAGFTFPADGGVDFGAALLSCASRRALTPRSRATWHAATSSARRDDVHVAGESRTRGIGRPSVGAARRSISSSCSAGQRFVERVLPAPSFIVVRRRRGRAGRRYQSPSGRWRRDRFGAPHGNALASG
jgi:hypothetical protein